MLTHKVKPPPSQRVQTCNVNTRDFREYYRKVNERINLFVFELGKVNHYFIVIRIDLKLFLNNLLHFRIIFSIAMFYDQCT